MDKRGIVSVTLADIYHEQGCIDKSVEILKELLKQEPANLFYKKKLQSLKKELKSKGRSSESRSIFGKKVW